MNSGSNYASKSDINKKRYGEVSLGLMDKGMPAATAFSLGTLVCFFKGMKKPVVVNHNQSIKKQLEAKLNLHFYQSLYLEEIDLQKGLPENINNNPIPYSVKTQATQLVNDGYNYLLRANGTFYMARTNSEGHKVLKIKRLGN